MQTQKWFNSVHHKGFANITLIIIIVLIAGGVGYYFAKQGKKEQTPAEKPVKEQTQNVVQCLPTILGNTNDLVSFSINPCDSVSGLTHVNAVVEGGYFFEGNILINILDENFNPLPYGPGHAQAATDWMTSDPVPFGFDVNFTPMPKGPTYIEIRNDNPSGDSQYNKYIRIPIIVN